MRIAVVGGGPGGLFFATLIRGLMPSCDVTVFERNRADDTFGFGVVFSDRTLAGIRAVDAGLHGALTTHGTHWETIEVRLKGESIRCGGNGMAAVPRRTLLLLMQDRARDAGVQLRFSTAVSLTDLADYDVVVAADGTGSTIREELHADLGTQVEVADAKFIWFGADHVFDGLTFLYEESVDGPFAVHAYPISDTVSTFIVETDDVTWRRAGLDAFDAATLPGISDMKSKRYVEALFGSHIRGRQLLVNNSRWSSFRTRRSRRWHTTTPRPVAFLGDAVHTAHFSVGSGTKMAMEDAVALARALAEHPENLSDALANYEAEAQPSVRRIQDAARPSLAWWENFGSYYTHFAPWQFAYHFLSRSITDAALSKRDAHFVANSHRRWKDEHGAAPLNTPLQTRGWRAPGRLVAVSSDDGGPVRVEGAHPLVLAPAAPTLGPWGAVIMAPNAEYGLPDTFERLAAITRDARKPDIVAVYGGSDLTRTAVSERARLGHGIPTLLCCPAGAVDATTRDLATTAVVSGRADLVGVIA